MFNKFTLSYITLLALFFIIGTLSGGKESDEWIVGFFIYSYFSYLVICFVFNKKMILPHASLNCGDIFLRKFVFVMSIIIMTVFSFN